MKLSVAEHRAIERENREKPAKKADRTERLAERIAELEDALYLKQVVLEGVAELLNAKIAELRAVDQMLNDMVAEARAKQRRPALAVAA